jgi:hypothetical protein
MNLAAIEAFARGAMSALLAGSETNGPHSRSPRRRRRSAPVERSSTSTAPRQLDLPISAPGMPDEPIAAPFTQAEVERMEAVLRGDAPQGFYKPDEGVTPWQG